MKPQFTIVPGRAHDRAAIGGVIRSAFAGMPYAAGDEAYLVEMLRAAEALTVSLVAELDGVVVCQIAFSPATPTDGSQAWYALGPVAVLPVHQCAGIGSQLVRAGMVAIGELAAQGCILTGNPTYYIRFGFGHSPANTPAGEPAEFFMVKRLAGELPVGPIQFHMASNSGACTLVVANRSALRPIGARTSGGSAAMLKTQRTDLVPA